MGRSYLIDYVRTTKYRNIFINIVEWWRIRRKNKSLASSSSPPFLSWELGMCLGFVFCCKLEN
jgi:hypothetical protein